MKEDQVFLSVVIPVFNEIETIEKLVKRVQDVSIKKEIIIVDDGSTDGTRDILNSLNNHNIKIFFHDKNRGKGAALKTGFKNCAGNMIIIQDADLEYNPVEYTKLLYPIIHMGADVVFGSRFIGEDPHRVHYFWHYVGNKVITLLSNMFTNLNLTDIESCYKLFKADVIKNISINSKGFGIEPELTSKVAKLKCKVYEVGISYAGRSYSEGKKITWKDGVTAIFTILKYGMFR